LTVQTGTLVHEARFRVQKIVFVAPRETASIPILLIYTATDEMRFKTDMLKVINETASRPTK
jgi:hypothetical protein